MSDKWKYVIDENIDKLYDPHRIYSKDVKYIDEDLNPCERANAACKLVWGENGSLLYVELKDDHEADA